ncbi:hypothetical protein [Adhaeretor mobilis]|uniref:hypothetical protein n=1 Tax=Adhaeretor mobilis TaxID=1930276 RepID=UPI0011A2C3EE|nr:hypothetical protein [Adhaeretor mobilis]
MLPVGIEQHQGLPEETAVSDSGGAECGAVGAQSAKVDADLAELIDHWADLPNAVKAGILAMVRAGEYIDSSPL